MTYRLTTLGFSMLLTAFKPFGGRRQNTSMDVAQRLVRRLRGVSRAKIHLVVLPVNFATSWRQCREAIDATNPGFIVMLGEKRAGKIAVEISAHNRRTKSGGLIPILKTGAEKVSSPLARQAYRNLPARQKNNCSLSRDAGNYLCNFVYYRALTYRHRAACVFIHVPALHGDNATGLQALVDTVFAIVTQVKMTFFHKSN